MSRHTFGTHPRRFSAASAAALDAGLYVRLEQAPAQGLLFAGADTFSTQELTSEVACLVARLRLRSFSLRHGLEEVTTALMVNVRCGFWPLAHRAALDLAALLRQARRRRLVDPELAVRGANGALRVAHLCSREVR
jgi:hypothetical protein